jgi:hypothetical protein
MNSDKHLLAMAVKVYGNIGPWENNWEPLIDDGDAFRLAVYCRIKFRISDTLGVALAWVRGEHDFESEVNLDDCHGDENAAIRRAIVLTAAKIGESLLSTRSVI